MERQEACDDNFVSPVGAESVASLEVYPTQVRGGKVTVDLGEQIETTTAHVAAVLTVVDFQGRTIRTQAATGQRTLVNLDGLRGGTYFLQSRSAAGVRSGRVTVMD